MKPYKCCQCGKLLFEAELRDGEIMKICPKCKMCNIFKARIDPPPKFQNDLEDAGHM